MPDGFGSGPIAASDGFGAGRIGVSEGGGAGRIGASGGCMIFKHTGNTRVGHGQNYRASSANKI